MRTLKFKLRFLAASLGFLVSILFAGSSGAADVDVYAEGAINGTQLTVYVYADVNVDNLLSYGVSLNYDTAELSVIDVQKDPEPIPYTSNSTKWYLGESTAVYRNNPAPDYSSPGEVIIIGGKLDPANPTQGVSQGARALLAVVTFGPADAEIPSSPTLFLSYARGDGTQTYKNFVRLDNNAPQVLDGADVYFGTVHVAQQGDANGSGDISPRDILFIKANIGNENAPCYTDCNGDGSITPRDILCVKSKI